MDILFGGGRGPEISPSENRSNILQNAKVDAFSSAFEKLSAVLITANCFERNKAYLQMRPDSELPMLVFINE